MKTDDNFKEKSHIYRSKLLLHYVSMPSLHYEFLRFFSFNYAETRKTSRKMYAAHTTVHIPLELKK